MEAYLDWSHLKQVWRVAKEIRKGKTGQIEWENHDYLTNRHRGRLKSDQILAVVRAHWAVENRCHWTMDVIWDEDSKVWCGQGVGIQVLGLLRLMAYNVVSLLRCRYWRTQEHTRTEKRRWQAWCDALFLLICQVGRALFPPQAGDRWHLNEPAGQWSWPRRRGSLTSTLLPTNTVDGPWPRHVGGCVREIGRRITGRALALRGYLYPIILRSGLGGVHPPLQKIRGVVYTG